MIIVDTITEIIDNLPLLIKYATNGFVFLSVFHFVLGKSNENNEVKIISSIFVSYILNCFYDTISINCFPNFVSNYPLLYFISTIIISIALAFLFGSLAKCERINNLISKTSGATLHKNFWCDVLKPGVWYRVHIKDSDVQYEGMFKTIEEDARCPFIEFKQYRIIDTDDGETVSNFNPFAKDNDIEPGETHSIIINMEEVDYIQVIDTRK